MEPVLEFTEYDTRLAAYVVIRDDEDRVLLALWNEPDEPQWTLPGGGVDLDETLEEGAVREAKEETGYDVRLGALLGVRTLVSRRRTEGATRPLRHVQVVFEATVVGGELQAEADGTTDEARWIPLADVPTLPRVYQVREFIG